MQIGQFDNEVKELEQFSHDKPWSDSEATENLTLTASVNV
ncbi:putative galectin [Schistosoma mansoni]|uniref:Putative galectin n=1 Tax=Schistosoma mansoni TaxID=6183 RepID=G4VGM1_SCHMA|nr:putative galectin [Schistosoma mansoni]|eukprot:XP_018650758.1 putative galectin [Schistosoma mansoni]